MCFSQEKNAHIIIKQLQRIILSMNKDCVLRKAKTEFLYLTLMNISVQSVTEINRFVDATKFPKHSKSTEKLEKDMNNCICPLIDIQYK